MKNALGGRRDPGFVGPLGGPTHKGPHTLVAYDRGHHCGRVARLLTRFGNKHCFMLGPWNQLRTEQSAPEEWCCAK